MNHVYDIIIIGSGISGSTLAQQLCKDYNIAVIEKDEKSGGVWRQTRWSWLKSDTTSLLYSPANEIGRSWIKKYKHFGVPSADIVQLTDSYLQNISVFYNHTVQTCSWNEDTWHVITDKQTFLSRWIIDSTGLYQSPRIPDFAKQIPSHIRVVHSSAFSDADISANVRVAVIGSRESGVQIIQGLHNKGVANIDWYGRSFENWYSAIDKPNCISSFIAFVAQYMPLWLWKFLRTFVHNKFMRWMTDVCLYQISRHINPYIPQSFYKDGFRYNWTQPFRPVFTFGSHIRDVNRIQLNNMSSIPFDSYDLIILATGFTQQPMFEINVCGDTKEVELFHLYRYILPNNIPNMFVVKPLAISSWVILECLVNSCKDILKKHFSDTQFIVPSSEYANYIQRQSAFLKNIGMTRELLTYHARANTFVYINEFM
jgi:hypothetical protein